MKSTWKDLVESEGNRKAGILETKEDVEALRKTLEEGTEPK